jgi:hypothetical protein
MIKKANWNYPITFSFLFLISKNSIYKAINLRRYAISFKFKDNYNLFTSAKQEESANTLV